MTRLGAVLLSAGVAVTTAACVKEALLTRSLRQEYPGIVFQVTVASGGRRLAIQVDSAAWRNYRLSTAELRSRGRPIAQFALQHYRAAVRPDSISIDFVQERSGALLWRSWSFESIAYAAGDLR